MECNELSSELDAPILDRFKNFLDFVFFPFGLSNFGWAAWFPFNKWQSNMYVMLRTVYFGWICTFISGELWLGVIRSSTVSPQFMSWRQNDADFLGGVVWWFITLKGSGNWKRLSIKKAIYGLSIYLFCTYNYIKDPWIDRLWIKVSAVLAGTVRLSPKVRRLKKWICHILVHTMG